MGERARLYRAGGGGEEGTSGEEMNAGVGNNRRLTANKEVGRKRLCSHSRAKVKFRVAGSSVPPPHTPHTHTSLTVEGRRCSRKEPPQTWAEHRKAPGRLNIII